MLIVFIDQLFNLEQNSRSTTIFLYQLSCILPHISISPTSYSSNFLYIRSFSLSGELDTTSMFDYSTALIGFHLSFLWVR